MNFSTLLYFFQRFNKGKKQKVSVVKVTYKTHPSPLKSILLNPKELKPCTSQVHFDESPTSSICPTFSSLSKTISIDSESSGYSIHDENWIMHHNRFIKASGVHLDKSVRPLLRLIESGDEFEKFLGFARRAAIRLKDSSSYSPNQTRVNVYYKQKLDPAKEFVRVHSFKMASGSEIKVVFELVLLPPNNVEENDENKEELFDKDNDSYVSQSFSTQTQYWNSENNSSDGETRVEDITIYSTRDVEVDSICSSSTEKSNQIKSSNSAEEIEPNNAPHYSEKDICDLSDNIPSKKSCSEIINGEETLEIQCHGLPLTPAGLLGIDSNANVLGGDHGKNDLLSKEFLRGPEPSWVTDIYR